jgi:hypothetical protein
LVQFVPLPPQCVFTNPTVVTPFNFAASETRVAKIPASTAAAAAANSADVNGCWQRLQPHLY